MEATVICLDNSEWMRNGDYSPTRFEAQNEAANFISTTKIESNPESAVALISMAGKSPKVLVTLSNDVGDILKSISAVQLEGHIDVLATLRVAQLVLKHKQNKSQRQKILIFIGSPVEAKTQELVQMGKLLKKNSVAVDIINIGEIFENDEKLSAFYTAVNSSGNPSHLITVPPGPHILSDFLISASSTLFGDGSSANIEDGEMGFDPNMDPELAHALRMSLEDERARRQREEEAVVSASAGDAAPSAPAPVPVPVPVPAPAASEEAAVPEPIPFEDDSMIVEDEDDELQQALALSKAQGDIADVNMEDADELTEEQQMELAMKLSMVADDSQPSQPSQTSSQPSASAETQEKQDSLGAEVAAAMNDANFVNSILSEFAVDADDPLIRETLNQIKREQEKDADKKE